MERMHVVGFDGRCCREHLWTHVRSLSKILKEAFIVAVENPELGAQQVKFILYQQGRPGVSDLGGRRELPLFCIAVCAPTASLDALII